MSSFLQASPPTLCAHLYPPPYAPHALPISFVLILPPAQYWVRSTDHSAPYLLTYIITYSIQQNPWEVNQFQISQIPCILWNPKVPYCVYKCSPPVPVLGQVSLVHASPLHFLKIHFNVVFHLCQGHSSVLFPLGFLTSPLPCACYVPCPSHPLFDHLNNIRWLVQIIKLLSM